MWPSKCGKVSKKLFLNYRLKKKKKRKKKKIFQRYSPYTKINALKKLRINFSKIEYTFRKNIIRVYLYIYVYL